MIRVSGLKVEGPETFYRGENVSSNGIGRLMACIGRFLVRLVRVVDVDFEGMIIPSVCYANVWPLII